MNMYRNPSSKSQGGGEDDKGFTLIEILIAIVLIGILSAVAVVGISNLVSKGTSSACGATKDAATAASAVYFAATNNNYPPTLAKLTSVKPAATAPITPLDVPASLTLPGGVTVNTALSVAPADPVGAAIGMQTVGGSWTMTMTPGATVTDPPTFGCKP
jgi:prepilin-type N-terminal cleavage/methylation domain-containing protein